MKYRLPHASLILMQAFFALGQLSAEPFKLDTDPNEEKIFEILRVYEQDLKENPDNLRLLYALGSAYYSLNDYKKAESLLERAYVLDPNYKDVQKTLGLTNLFLGRLDRARELLVAYHEKHPEDLHTIVGLARVEQLTYNIDKAEPLYKEALTKDPADISALTFYGDMLLQDKRFSQAAQVFERLKKEKPDDREVDRALLFAKLGPTLQEIEDLANSGKREDALSRYNELVEKYPQEEKIRLLQGALLVQLGQFDEAISLYNRGLQLRPGSESLKVAIGQSYLAQEDLFRAKSAFEGVLKENPENVDALAGLGALFVKEGKTAEANQVLEEGLKLAPYNEALLYEAATLWMKEKKYAQAERLWHRLSKINASSSYIREMEQRAAFGPLLDEIAIKTKFKQYSEVEELYKKLLKQATENPDFYADFGRFYMDRKQPKKAQSIYLQGLKKNPGNIDLQILLGFAYVEDLSPNKGETLFRKVLDENPVNAEALSGLGKIVEMDGNFEEAEKYYNQALEIDPESVTALSALAHLKVQEKKYRKAEKLYSKIVSKYPDFSWARRALDEVKFKKVLDQIEEGKKEKNFEEVEILYRQMIGTSPDIVDYTLGLGQLFVQNKRFDDAEELYIEALKKHPDSLQLKDALAYVELKLGKVDEAAALYQGVLAKFSEDPDALAGMGRIAEIQGNNARALEYYSKALKSDPQNITALGYRAALLVLMRDYDEALKNYLTLKALLPNDEWVRFAIQDIYNAPTLEKIQELLKVQGLNEQEKIARQLEAEALFRKLLKKSQKNPNYYLRLGLLLGEMRRFDDAISIYKRGLQFDPENASLMTAVGFSYIYKNDLVQAKEEFLKVLKNVPDYGDAWAGLGRVAELEGDGVEARSRFEEALSYTPDSVTVLTMAAPFFAKEGDSVKAKELFSRLIALAPGQLWIKKAQQDAEAQPLLARAHAFEQAGNLAEAAAIWGQLAGIYRGDEEYILGFGNLLVRMEKFDQAIEIFEQGLKENPGSLRLTSALGLALLFNKELPEAKSAFEQVLAVDPKNGEALSGLGRVYALEGDPKAAERLYNDALKQSPDNQAALSFYGDLLLKERRFEEAQEIFGRLVELDPQALWARRAEKNAELGPEIDEARLFDELGEDKWAKALYADLIGKASGNYEYYLYLGDLYLKKERWSEAITIYQMGLQAEPNSPHLRRAIAYVWLDLEEPCEAQKIFTALLEEDPKDADAWAGLGRAQSLKGFYCLAENYYAKALELEPKNETANVFFAQDQSEQERHFSASRLYIYLEKQNPNRGWISDRLDENWRKTRDKITIGGGYYEEDEWNRPDEVWSARYQVFGGHIRLESPLNDCTWLNGRVGDDFYRLVDRINDNTLYFFNSTWAHIGGKKVLDPSHYIEGSIGLSAWSPYRKAYFAQKHGIAFEPELAATWHNRDKESATLGIGSLTDLVARNFDTYNSELVTRYFVFGDYKKEFFNELLLNIQGGYYWLTDFQKNTFQRALASLYWRPECFFKNFAFLYFIQYQNYDKVIPDYWTYSPQIVNHLQVEYKREYNDLTDVTLGYAHGWQSSRTRFAQIVINQPLVFQPLFWDRREYNTGFIRIDYDACPFKLATNAWYYRDTKKYTIWYANLDLTFEF